MTDWPTRFADRYDVVRRLGQGAFARTYLAEDSTGGRQVALKILDPAQAEDWKTFEMFEREAAVLKTLRHQGIPEVFETVRGDWLGRQVHAIALEFIDGQSIAQRIEQGGGLDRAGVMHLFLEMLGVLDYLHSRIPPILHRDIKPANIIVRPDGNPVLVDFGAVRNVVRGDGGSTIAGTYGYMPYEQYMGQATASSDLYALAATFLHLVTGSPPPMFLNPAGRIEVPEALSCQEPLRSVLARMLQPSPSDRYQSAREVRDSLFRAPAAAPTGPGVAVAVAQSSAPVRVPALGPPIALDPGPRVITGDLKKLYHRLAPGVLQTIDPDAARRGGRWRLIDMLVVGFFSAVSFGVLPLIYGVTVANRRNRVRPFLESGQLREAVILGMEIETSSLGTKEMRVRYQFEVDGRVIRSSDLVSRNRAERWQVGEAVQVLYLPERDDDSIIAA